MLGKNVPNYDHFYAEICHSSFPVIVRTHLRVYERRLSFVSFETNSRIDKEAFRKF